MEKLYLVLENGKVFKGESFGASGEVTGEIVFATSMTGYIETLTDPSYYGQIVVQTFPLIGNYGIIPSDFESDHPHLSAYVVREWCESPSNFRCEEDINTFLKNNNIVAISGIDTRHLTKIIREYGVMNAKIVKSLDNLDDDLKEIKSYRIKDAVKNTTCKSPYTLKGENPNKKVVLMDFGEKKNIERELIKRNCEVITVPSFTKADEIIKINPDGIMLSNGPGDPTENVEVIEEIKKLCNSNIPIFGICLGHQLTALSQGAKTIKLKYGHRGANQPVKDVKTGKVYISSQNHGYAVDSNTLPSHAHLSFINVNDDTCEGLEYDNMPVYTVQFHPEASAGPKDTIFLFNKFISEIGGKN